MSKKRNDSGLSSVRVVEWHWSGKVLWRLEIETPDEVWRVWLPEV